MRSLFPEFRALRYGTSLSGGNLPALKTAIDCGADAVYIGFKDDTNARHFAGLNFSGKKLEKAVDYVHDHHKKFILHSTPSPILMASSAGLTR